jgi:hypothetical protein
MSASVRRRLSALERSGSATAPSLLLVVNRAGTENCQDDIMGIDCDGTRLDRHHGESIGSMIDRAKAQIVGGGVHIMRLIHDHPSRLDGPGNSAVTAD